MEAAARVVLVRADHKGWELRAAAGRAAKRAAEGRGHALARRERPVVEAPPRAKAFGAVRVPARLTRYAVEVFRGGAAATTWIFRRGG